MSRKDRESWEAWLAADPDLQAAWDGFRATLARVTGQDHFDRRSLEDLREAAARVQAEAGEDQSHH